MNMHNLTYNKIKNILLKRLNELILTCEELSLKINENSLRNFNLFLNYVESDHIIPQISVYSINEIGINWRNNSCIYTVIFTKDNNIIWSYINNDEACGCIKFNYLAIFQINHTVHELFNKN